MNPLAGIIGGLCYLVGLIYGTCWFVPRWFGRNR